MQSLREIAYGTYLGPFPMIALVGFVAYGLFFATALVTGLKRWVPAFRRVSIRTHRLMAMVALLVATFHLLLGIAAYL